MYLCEIGEFGSFGAAGYERFSVVCGICGCSADVEQSATTDQGRLLATDISAGDQVSSFSTSHLADGSLALSLLIDS